MVSARRMHSFARARNISAVRKAASYFRLRPTTTRCRQNQFHEHERIPPAALNLKTSSFDKRKAFVRACNYFKPADFRHRPRGSIATKKSPATGGARADSRGASLQ